MLRWLWLAALVFAPFATPAAEAPPHKALHALFDREFRWALKEFPEYATHVGVSDHDDRLTVSPTEGPQHGLVALAKEMPLRDAASRIDEWIAGQNRMAAASSR